MYPRVKLSIFFSARQVFPSPRPCGIVNIHQAFARMHDLGEQMGLMRKRSVKAAYVRASRWHLLVKMFLSYALVPSS